MWLQERTECTHTHTHTSKTAGTDRHVRTESAVAPLPPRPAFRLGLCMSNTTKLAIAVQHTAETSNRPLHTLEIVQAALKQRVKKMSCNYNKPKPNPVVLFQAKALPFWQNEEGYCSQFKMLPGFVTGMSETVYTITPEESHKIQICLFVWGKH